MRRSLQRTRLLIGGLALAATLLAVVATALHHHEHGLVPIDCATCVLAHHAPATVAPSATLVAPVEHVLPVADAPARPVGSSRVRRALGRAPPHLPLAIHL